MAGRATVQPISYGGWEHNLRLSNGEVELVVTLDIGPRIMRYAPLGGANVLKEVTEALGGLGEDTWKIRGGHRLWIAPEDPVRTYVLDNSPIEHAVIAAGAGCRVRVTAPADSRFGIEKTLEIELGDRGSDVTLVHRVRNLSSAPTELAIWAITVMAQGGTEIVPLPSGRNHPGLDARSAEDFAPHLTMALWPYFRFDDPRVLLGRRCVRLRQDPEASGPTKLGFAHRAGWAAYVNRGLGFVKRFGYEEGARYPDGGCNYETYTDAGFLEMETLGPLVRLEPGGETSHMERWSLLKDAPAPESEEIVESALFPRISSRVPI